MGDLNNKRPIEVDADLRASADRAKIQTNFGDGLTGVVEQTAVQTANRRQVYLEGRLRLEEYADREGNPRISPEVTATDIQFLGQRGDSDLAHLRVLWRAD